MTNKMKRGYDLALYEHLGAEKYNEYIADPRSRRNLERYEAGEIDTGDYKQIRDTIDESYGLTGKVWGELEARYNLPDSIRSQSND